MAKPPQFVLINFKTQVVSIESQKLDSNPAKSLVNQNQGPPMAQRENQLYRL